jgi:hypothetical protein
MQDQNDEDNVTIRDVASLAQVSKSTVSRVINDRSYVSDHARSKVREAMRELDYEPNRRARSLGFRSGRTSDAWEERSEAQNPGAHLIFEGDWTDREQRTVEENATGSGAWLCVKTRIEGTQTFVAVKMDRTSPVFARQGSAGELALRIRGP